MNQARKDVLREDNGDFQMKVIGSVFSGAGKDGDFDWMITQDHYEDALFVFNDNEGQYKAHRDQPTDLAGAGWSVRPATRGQAWKRLETIYFLGLTLYCTRNRKGNFKVGMRTEKSRLRRSLTSLQELMRRIRHYAISDQAGEINAALRGHYAYYGVAGNLRALIKVYQVVERYWRRMLCSRSRDGGRLTWGTFNQIKERNPLLRPKLRLPHRELQALAVL
jgi:hypothetical protein